ncbi:hypothetical protein AAFF_G00416220 [Aldrovandia affinis]|uniref:Uncharacterized protein n=1 Tax=Aldrovandia affinis TaxID=143900 RepID=A0AAD7WJH2_9TELE|nr:hypothetical protein AAFF_G00416220 [Aldrovandia affinis]
MTKGHHPLPPHLKVPRSLKPTLPVLDDSSRVMDFLNLTVALRAPATIDSVAGGAAWHPDPPCAFDGPATGQNKRRQMPSFLPRPTAATAIGANSSNKGVIGTTPRGARVTCSAFRKGHARPALPLDL